MYTETCKHFQISMTAQLCHAETGLAWTVLLLTHAIVISDTLAKLVKLVQLILLLFYTGCVLCSFDFVGA